MTMSVFEEKVGKNLVVEKLIEKEVKVSLTDNDLEEYYKKIPRSSRNLRQ